MCYTTLSGTDIAVTCSTAYNTHPLFKSSVYSENGNNKQSLNMTVKLVVKVVPIKRTLDYSFIILLLNTQWCLVVPISSAFRMKAGNRPWIARQSIATH